MIGVHKYIDQHQQEVRVYMGYFEVAFVLFQFYKHGYFEVSFVLFQFYNSWLSFWMYTLV
jgi:hypothetical protein